MAQPATNRDAAAHAPGAGQPQHRPALRVHKGGATVPPAAVPDPPEPGTRVVLHTSRGPRHGAVMPYDRRWCWHSYPVRFDDNTQWRLLSCAMLTLEPQRDSQ